MQARAATGLQDLVTAGLVTAADVPGLTPVEAAFRIRVTPAMRAATVAANDPVGRQFVPTRDELTIRPEELFEDPHLLHSGGLANLQLEDGSFTPMPLLPLSLDGERLQPRRSIPRIGEHTHKVMRDLGYSDSRIAELCAAGVLKFLTRLQQRLVTDHTQAFDFFMQALGVVDVPSA